VASIVAVNGGGKWTPVAHVSFAPPRGLLINPPARGVGCLFRRFAADTNILTTF